MYVCTLIYIYIIYGPMHIPHTHIIEELELSNVETEKDRLEKKEKRKV